MGDWNFQFAPVCLPDELADPFFEEQERRGSGGKDGRVSAETGKDAGNEA